MITEPAIPSFAAKTASTLLSFATRICSKSVSACWLSQSGTSWSAATSQSPAATFFETAKSPVSL